MQLDDTSAANTPIPEELPDAPPWASAFVTQMNRMEARIRSDITKSNTALQQQIEALQTSNLQLQDKYQQLERQVQQLQQQHTVSGPSVSYAPTVVPTQAPTPTGHQTAPMGMQLPQPVSNDPDNYIPPHTLILGGFPKDTKDQVRIAAAKEILRRLRATGGMYMTPTAPKLRHGTIMLKLLPTAPSYILHQTKTEFDALTDKTYAPDTSTSYNLWVNLPKTKARLRRNNAVTTSLQLIKNMYPTVNAQACYASGVIEINDKITIKATAKCTIQIVDAAIITDAQAFQDAFAAALEE